ncbi:unnamed protein product [Ixodes persulcatus]
MLRFAKHLLTFVMCKQDKVIFKPILRNLFLQILMSTPAENTSPVPTRITPSFLGMLLSSISVVMSEDCSRRIAHPSGPTHVQRHLQCQIGTKLVGPLAGRIA